MTGFVIAAIALVLLVVLMKVHITPEEAEELAAYEKAEKEAKRAEEESKPLPELKNYNKEDKSI